MTSATPNPPLTPADNIMPATSTSPPQTPHLTTTTPIDPRDLRPDCLAKERLRKWRPASAPIVPLTRQDGKSMSEILEVGFAESTRESYGSGLKQYHNFCDLKGIGELERAPASRELITQFVGSIIGFYPPSSIRTYYAGIQAWHRIHSLPFAADEKEIDLLIRAAAKLAPDNAHLPKRSPLTVETINKIHAQVDPNSTIDTAVFACLTTCFYAIARLGEFTVERIKDPFDPAKHVSIKNMRSDVDRDNNRVTELHIPSTKIQPTQGEKVHWAKQNGPSDPVQAMAAHVTLNNPSENEHLFSYTLNNSRQPLSHKKCIERLNALASRAGIKEKIHGHSIRIGGTLEYLLRNIPFEVVKTMGRWSSDTFQRYLRKHGQILAKYIQNTPVFNRLINELPPVHG